MLILKQLRWCIFIPRICTLAAAISLAIAVLCSNFLGIDKPIALISASVIGFGLLVTVVTVIFILYLFRTIRETIDNDDDNDQNDELSQVSVLLERRGSGQKDDEKQMITSSKTEVINDQPCLQALSSLTTTTAFSFRSMSQPFE